MKKSTSINDISLSFIFQEVIEWRLRRGVGELSYKFFKDELKLIFVLKGSMNDAHSDELTSKISIFKNILKNHLFLIVWQTIPSRQS